ncbi:MAG: DUF3618 domain-containing protein [Candidatus Nanopelagicales bacterium]
MSSPEEIRDDIDATREQLRSDVQALQSKVDPVENLDRGLVRVEELTAEKPYAMGASAFVAGWFGAWLIAKL